MVNFSLQSAGTGENARLFGRRFMAAWEAVADDEHTPNTKAAGLQRVAYLAKNCTVFREVWEAR